MPRSNKPICTKNPTNPRNFVNLEIKLANLKIAPKKHTRKKKSPQIWLTKTKPKPKFCSQKHENKKKKKNKTQTHPVVGL